MCRKKTAFLLGGINAGGTENYLLRLLKHNQEKIEATIYCKSGKLGELEMEFRQLGVRLIPFRIGYFNIMKLIALKKEFKNENYDAVCDLTGSFGALPLLIAKKAGVIKRIAFFRNSREKFKKNILKVQYNKFITFLLPKIATKILSNSKSAFNYFYTNSWQTNKKFEVIYNGINSLDFINESNNLRKELGISLDSFVVGHVGRFNDQKNHKTAIEVAIQLCKEYKDVSFVFCGKNVDLVYNSLIEESKLQGQIKLLGVRRDINKVLNTLNCFYFPSLIEGQPNALIEALIMGVPFVSSDIESIKETVPGKFHKQLIKPMDVLGAKIKILEIKNNKDIRQELNIANWAIDFYNPEKWFHLVYQEL
jgi:glycosyltransferase involved in cell wall biosynthesis